MSRIDVLVPTCNRPSALAVTLASLLGQGTAARRLIVSDQGDEPATDRSAELRAVLRVLGAEGWDVEVHRHLPRRGMAEQRQFLLDRATAPYGLFLDDDVVLGPGLLRQLLDVIVEEGCGFVGSAPIGLTYERDERPGEQELEPWHGPVRPERIEPGGAGWERHRVHNAANVLHVARRLGASRAAPMPYRVAWVGACVLYDVAALRAAEGFGFWRELPAGHAGEDALAQLRVMARSGGCAILPSRAYHLELPTTLPDREIDAPWVLDGPDDPQPEPVRVDREPARSRPRGPRGTARRARRVAGSRGRRG